MVDVGHTPDENLTKKPDIEHKPGKESTVEWNADKAAKRGQEHERKYDQEHDIFKD